MSLDVEANA